jgi:hypothetical protein
MKSLVVNMLSRLVDRAGYAAPMRPAKCNGNYDNAPGHLRNVPSPVAQLQRLRAEGRRTAIKNQGYKW